MLISSNPAVQHLIDAGRIAAPKPQPGPGAGDDFGKTLMDVLKEVNDSQNKASELQTDLMTNRRPVEYHDVMISMEKADTTMQLTVAVRNKALEAFQEIEKMPV
jgi:flagellar hook-basal body complex protein FliE